MFPNTRISMTSRVNPFKRDVSSDAVLPTQTNKYKKQDSSHLPMCLKQEPANTIDFFIKYISRSEFSRRDFVGMHICKEGNVGFSRVNPDQDDLEINQPFLLKSVITKIDDWKQLKTKEKNISHAIKGTTPLNILRITISSISLPSIILLACLLLMVCIGLFSIFFPPLALTIIPAFISIFKLNIMIIILKVLLGTTLSFGITTLFYLVTMHFYSRTKGTKLLQKELSEKDMELRKDLLKLPLKDMLKSFGELFYWEEEDLYNYLVNQNNQNPTATLEDLVTSEQKLQSLQLELEPEYKELKPEHNNSHLTQSFYGVDGKYSEMDPSYVDVQPSAPPFDDENMVYLDLTYKSIPSL